MRKRLSLLLFGVPIVALALGRTVAPERMRVATYNMEWFSEEANPERIANLKSVVANLKADVISMEEVQSRKAVEQP